MNFSAEMGGWMQWRAEDVHGEQGNCGQLHEGRTWEGRIWQQFPGEVPIPLFDLRYPYEVAVSATFPFVIFLYAHCASGYGAGEWP